MKNSLFVKGVKDAFPIFLGYFAVSFALGITAVSAGISPFEITLMSATNFTSAGQYAAITAIKAAQTYLVVGLGQLVINMRYFLMSSSLSQKFSRETSLIHRFIIAFGNTDEVFALLSKYNGYLPISYCYGVVCCALPGWALGTLVGALAGNILPQKILSALGIILFAMFFAIIIPPARENGAVNGIVFASMEISALFFYVPALKKIPSGITVILITVIVALIASVFKPIEEDGHEG